MATVTVAKPKRGAAFPAAEIEACIRDFLTEEATMQAALHGCAGAVTEMGTTFGPQPVIDSLVVVEVLIELEPKVPFALPESLIRPGGYDSVDEVVADLVPRLERRWRNHQREKS